MPEWIVTLLWVLFGLLLLSANLIVLAGLCAGAWGLFDYLRDPAAWRERQREAQVKKMREQQDDLRRVMDGRRPTGLAPIQRLHSKDNDL